MPYLLWKRAWKALAGCALGLVLFFGIIPGLFLGMERNAALLGSWYERMVKPFLVDGVVTTENLNQSLPGVVYRLVTHSPSAIGYDENDQAVPLEYDNILALDPSAARWLLKGFLGLYVLAVIWSCRTPLAVRQGWRLAAEYSLILLGMLLFSEPHLEAPLRVTLLLREFSVVAYYLAVCKPGRRMRWCLIGSLAAVAILMTLTARPGRSTISFLGDAKLAHVYGAYVWAYLILIGAMIGILRHHASISPTTDPLATSGSGLPVRSVSVVSGSIPIK